jgi:hypothetical protein
MGRERSIPIPVSAEMKAALKSGDAKAAYKAWDDAARLALGSDATVDRRAVEKKSREAAKDALAAGVAKSWVLKIDARDVSDGKTPALPEKDEETAE